MKKRLLPAICRIIGILIIIAVIVSAVLLTVPRFFGLSVYHVESGSMAPALPVGSLIYVKKVEPESIQPGDIITFVLEGSTITHRVVENRFVEGELVTKGDANEQEDIHLVPYANIVGKVSSHLPVLSKLLVVYSTGLGKFYVLLVAACGVLLLVLGGMLKKSKE